ncbi:MAG: hypothetical protein GY788_01385 [bacterium]|nr:hypothetical protein [bacterium]
MTDRERQTNPTGRKSNGSKRTATSGLGENAPGRGRHAPPGLHHSTKPTVVSMGFQAVHSHALTVATVTASGGTT